MTPFHSRFLDIAARETRSIHVLAPGSGLPMGEYSLMEWFCDDPDCDCRRVLVQVVPAGHPERVLATINYGWEPVEFYTRWMHGDKQAGREIAGGNLDPLHPKSEYAEKLLEIFRDIVATDPEYVERLARHYDLFKSTQRPPGKVAMPVETVAHEAPANSLPMTIPQILQQLELVSEEANFAPYEAALRAAIDQQEAITPELIAAIERVSADPKTFLEHPERCLYLFSIYLLAQFRETRAMDCFVRFFSLPGELALDLTGDLVTEEGAAVLASVCGGNPQPLIRLALDESVNEFVRGQAIQALLVQSVWQERPREAVIADLRNLFSSMAKPGDGFVWAELVGAVDTFNAVELLPEVRQAFADTLVDETVINLEDIEPTPEYKQRGYPVLTREERFRQFTEHNQPIDAIAACSAWLCFDDGETELPSGPEDEDSDWGTLEPDPRGLPEDETERWEPPQPYIAPPKIGRNDPCPCGSGKKYKKCCGK
jgi:hypothetical protein